MAPKKFFEKIKTKYGNDVVISMKKVLKLKSKLAKASNKKIFLLRCRKQHLIPKHRKYKNVHNINSTVFKRLESRFIFAVMNQEIAETLININRTNKLITHRLQFIKNLISSYFFRNFKVKLDDYFNHIFDRIRTTHLSKFTQLCTRDSVTQSNRDTVNNNSTFTTAENNNDWLVNLSDTEIPENVSNILRLGEKFCPPAALKSVPYIHLIAEVEGALMYKKDEDLDKALLRSEFVNILTNFSNRHKYKQHPNINDMNLIRDVSHTKKFVKDHNEILITRADKGNTTVIVKRSDYLEKMHLMLADTNTYKQINIDNCGSIQKKLNHMVTSWQNEGRIVEAEAKSLRCYHGVVAKLYGLPKIHKENTPYRPIVSSIGTPLYALSAYLSKILNLTVGKSSTAVKNSTEFKQKIHDIKIPQDHIILSLDVVSLFTNIDCNLAITLIDEKWSVIKRNSKTKLKKVQYIEAMQMVLRNCEFSFNGHMYAQLFGSPMGSPASPAIAELVMEFVETNVLSSLDFTPAFYFRYVDDIVTAIPKQKIEYFFQKFNAFNKNIKFTIELENHNKLPFLDLLIIRNGDGSLSTDWFHKSTWSGRYLNFNSHLPISYKKNTIKLLSNKILQLSDPIFHRSNFNLLRSTLLNNNYPYSFFNPIIKSTIYRHSVKEHSNFSARYPSSDENSQTHTIAIPYINTLYEQMSHCLKKFNFRTVGRSHNSLGRLVFSSKKDPTQLGHNRNVVYKIECECKQAYIGQTQQLLSTRFYQHKRDAKKLALKKMTSDLTSSLSNHLHETRHDIFLENVKILDKEENHNKRRVLEMIYIKKNPNSMNKQSDCTYLNNTYNHLIHK